MEQLQHLTVRNVSGQHPTVVSLLEAPASMVVVYSDNGTPKLSPSTHVGAGWPLPLFSAPAPLAVACRVSWPATLAVATQRLAGSKLSRCVNVSKILRQLLQPERVRRLRGGLNGWKRAGLPVDGDARAMFAGQPADVAMLQGGMAGLMQ